MIENPAWVSTLPHNLASIRDMSRMINVRVRAAILLATLTIASDSLSRELAPLEAYGKLPEVRLATLSPSGNRLALLRNEGEQGIIFVYDLDAGETIAGVDVRDLNARELRFANEDKLLIIAGKATNMVFTRRFDYSAAFVLDLNTGKVRQLLSRATDLYMPQAGLGRIVGQSPDGNTIYMPAFNTKRNSSNPSYGIYAVSLNKRRERLKSSGYERTIDWFVNERGEPIAREDFDDRRNLHQVLAIEDGKGRVLYEDESELRRLNPVGVAADRTAIITTAYSPETGKRSFYSLSLDDGALVGPILGRDDASVEQVIRDLDRTVYGVGYSGFLPTYEFFDDALNQRVRDAQAKLTGTAVRLESWSDDFSRLLFHISGGWNSGAYLVASGEQLELTLIDVDRSDIPRELVVPTNITEYAARDGLKIPALVTAQPEVIANGGAPLVVIPHGGPESYDRFGFDWLAQFLASRGNVVLQPQFRGSDGFGIEFRDAGRGEWGGKMQADVDDGVAHLVAAGTVDPERVCIIGASYGGYAALAGGAFSPETYRCVVSINGVSDLNRMIEARAREAGRDNWVVSYWERLYGARRVDDDALRAISPAFHAENFEAPVLLIHGRDDVVVPIEQSRRMNRALEKAGKDVTFIQLKGEDHYLSYYDSRLATLQAIADFVSTHL